MIKQYSKLIRIIAIILSLILSASLIMQIEDVRGSPPAPTVSSDPSDSDQDQSGSVGSSSVSWCKDPSHQYHPLTEMYCNGCDEYYYSVDDFNCVGVESCGYATCYYDVTCSKCGSAFDEDCVVSRCCFLNGVCHICGRACTHICNVLDSFYKWVLPASHPLNKASFPFQPDDSYVINGQCMMCFMTVEN